MEYIYPLCLIIFYLFNWTELGERRLKMHWIRKEQGLAEAKGVQSSQYEACSTMNPPRSLMRSIFIDAEAKILGWKECIPAICHLGWEWFLISGWETASNCSWMTSSLELPSPDEHDLFLWNPTRFHLRLRFLFHECALEMLFSFLTDRCPRTI